MAEALNPAGKEQLALALHLLRQWKTQDGPRFQPDVTMQILKMADHLGVREAYDALLVPLPRYRFVAID